MNPATPTEALPAPMSTSQASTYQQLRAHLASLKLHAAAEHLPSVLATAQSEGWSMTATLEHLLAREVEATEARKLAGRLRFASLPTPATLAEFDFDAAPGVDRKLIDDLATCRYLESATNVLLIGPPGVGKTHLAVGLGRAAAEAGYPHLLHHRRRSWSTAWPTTRPARRRRACAPRRAGPRAPRPPSDRGCGRPPVARRPPGTPGPCPGPVRATGAGLRPGRTREPVARTVRTCSGNVSGAARARGGPARPHRARPAR